jgi:hypothetical protein
VHHGQLKQCDPGPSYDCFRGLHNFVLDVFPGGDLLDYENGRDCFERNRVREYVVLCDTEPVQWIWNHLIDSMFSVIGTAGSEPIISTALPELGIPALALKQRHSWAVMAAIPRGRKIKLGHYDFMQTIWEAGKNRT